MTIEHKKGIVRWIMDNPGYVYSRFTFMPEYNDEVLPTEKEFETLTYNIEEWEEVENAPLPEDEQEMYPGATHRYKYIFQQLNGSLYAHIFVDNEDNIQYIVVLT